MKWHSSYETGNTTVDNDHKEIFSLVDSLINSSFENQRESVTKAIDYLAGYVVRHFGNEERLMEESNYPRMEEHKKQHSDFVGVALGLREKYVSQPENASDIGLEINKTIVDWLSEHVLGSDKALADHYKKWGG
ncbi:MAG: hemerythrin family protein [Defluviitaleaceae bacterium]|nr:hemerythrin family protein [Defluviitaleaceae bacterium]